MSKIINTNVIAALRAAASFAEKVVVLRDSITADVLRDKQALTLSIRPGVAKFYGIECAEHGATGKFVTEDEQLSASARTALSKLVRAVQGPTAHQKEVVKVRVAKTEKEAYAAFLAACGGDSSRMAAVIKAMKA